MLCGLQTDRQTKNEYCCVFFRQTDKRGMGNAMWFADRRRMRNAVWFADRSADEEGRMLCGLQTD